MKSDPTGTMVLTADQIIRARRWMASHRIHVLGLTATTAEAFAPTLAADRNDPALWKAGHWRWFLAHEVAAKRSGTS